MLNCQGLQLLPSVNAERLSFTSQMKTLYIEQEKSSELIKLMSNSTKVIVFVLLSYTVSVLPDLIC
jgi:hypothetical protein